MVPKTKIIDNTLSDTVPVSSMLGLKLCILAMLPFPLGWWYSYVSQWSGFVLFSKCMVSRIFLWHLTSICQGKYCDTNLWFKERWM